MCSVANPRRMGRPSPVFNRPSAPDTPRTNPPRHYDAAISRDPGHIRVSRSVVPDEPAITANLLTGEVGRLNAGQEHSHGSELLRRSIPAGRNRRLRVGARLL